MAYAAPPWSARPAHRTGTLLLLDERATAASLYRALRAAGYNVLHTRTLEQALHLATRRKPGAIVYRTRDRLIAALDGIGALRHAPATAALPLAVIAPSRLSSMDLGPRGVWVTEPVAAHWLLRKIGCVTTPRSKVHRDEPLPAPPRLLPRRRPAPRLTGGAAAVVVV